MSSKLILKTYFESGKRPKDTDFADLIESSVNWQDEKASDADAENSTIDNKFITPKTARKSVEKYAPVKKVNTKSPNASGEITIATSDISGLDTSINSKQATLVSGTNIKSINGTSILAAGDLALATPAALDLKMSLPVIAKATGAVNSSSIARANVAGLSFSAAANKKYKVEILGSYQNNTVTAGGSLGLTLSAGSGNISGTVEMQTAAAGSEKKLISVINTANTDANSFITSSHVAAAGAAGFIAATLYFECVAAGNFLVQWASGVDTTTATLNNAVMIVTPLN